MISEGERSDDENSTGLSMEDTSLQPSLKAVPQRLEETLKQQGIVGSSWK